MTGPETIDFPATWNPDAGSAVKLSTEGPVGNDVYCNPAKVATPEVNVATTFELRDPDGSDATAIVSPVLDLSSFPHE